MKTPIEHRGQDALLLVSRLCALVDDPTPFFEDPITRGRALAADPSYPSFSLCEQIASALISSDFSSAQR